MWIFCSLISAALQSTEAYCVSSSHPERKHLKRAARIKIAFCCAAAGTAAAFGLSYQVCDGKVSPGDPAICDRVSTTCAVLEWLLALGFSGCACESACAADAVDLLTLVLDLWPARQSAVPEPEMATAALPSASLPSGQTFQPTPSAMAAWQPQATLPPDGDPPSRSGVAFASTIEFAPPARVFSTASSLK